MPGACWAGCGEGQALEGSLAGGTVWPGKLPSAGERCVFSHTQPPFGNCSLRGLLKDWKEGWIICDRQQRRDHRVVNSSLCCRTNDGCLMSTCSITHMNIDMYGKRDSYSQSFFKKVTLRTSRWRYELLWANANVTIGVWRAAVVNPPWPAHQQPCHWKDVTANVQIV